MYPHWNTIKRKSNLMIKKGKLNNNHDSKAI